MFMSKNKIKYSFTILSVFGLAACNIFPNEHFEVAQSNVHSGGAMIQIPQTCEGSGTYYFVTDGNSDVISRKISGSDQRGVGGGLSSKEQKDAAIQIMDCFQKARLAAQNGNWSFYDGDQAIFASDEVEYSDAQIKSTDSPFSWSYQVNIGEVETLGESLRGDGYTLREEWPEQTAVINELLADHVFEDILEGNGRDYSKVMFTPKH